MNEINDTVLTEITRRIVAASDPQQIILFGSQARGDASQDSDLDLLVIKDEMESPRVEAASIYRALAGLSTPVDVVVRRSATVQRYRDIVGTIERTAMLEGRVLYAR